MSIRQFLPSILLLLATSCAKEAGIGGRGEIHGRVMEQYFDNDTPTGEAYPKAGERVYIVYGGGTGDTGDDNVRTGPDGRFRFAWLRKGDYRIYVISECADNIQCPNGSRSVGQQVHLDTRKSMVDVGDLLIDNY